MQAQDLVNRVSEYDKGLASDLQKFLGSRKLGLVYEESKPEYVRLTNKPVVVGDLVNVLPPRGTMEDLSDDADEHDVIWRVVGQHERMASLRNMSSGKEASLDDLVAVARFDQPIYCGLTETGHVEHGGKDDPYQVVINGENFHALESLLYCYEGKVDCIYIDPPYNTGAKDWKYNNNYVSGDDAYRHSKWLTFMEDRLRLAKRLLNPKDAVLVCAIDEKEYLRLGLLLEQLFSNARIQMISCRINPQGVARSGAFTRCDEYLFFVMIGNAVPIPQELSEEWLGVKSTVKNGLHWCSLLRTGTNNMRSDRPNLFYPVFVSTDGTRFLGVGESLDIGKDRNSVAPPHDGVAIWPIHSDMSEGCWQVDQTYVKRIQEAGFLRLGKFTPRGMGLSYLKAGEQKKVNAGLFPITNYREDGSIVVSADEYKASYIPSTQWRIDAHDASRNGSNLLTSIIGKRQFTFPKSLYAVEDTIRFFISDKPNALILDFFAGSGTTAHAVMRLNHQDGGHRRCICVTNNEVSADEAKTMTKRGLRAGDEEWEERGIARYVTVPRVTAAITGKTPEGEPIKGDYKFTDEFPMANGFEENAVFYDLTYLEPSVVSADLAFDEIAPLLWLRSGSRGPVIMHGDTYEVTDAYGVLFDYTCSAEFIKECHERDVDHIFVVTDIDANYRRMCSEFRGKDVAQLYKSYLRSFEIGADR